MPKDDIELAYDSAFSYVMDAMYSLRRIHGNEAIASLRAAIRAIENGQRVAEQKHRRQEARRYIEGSLSLTRPFSSVSKSDEPPEAA